MLVGCSINYGFRGVAEHTKLLKKDVENGIFGQNEPYPGLKWVGVGAMVNYKGNTVSTHDSYVRDTTNIMRLPVFDETNLNDFAASMLRYIKKLDPAQERFYCFPNKNFLPGSTMSPYMKKKPVGKDTINKYFKDAARLMGLDMTNFKGGHAFRRYFVTSLANDPNVSLQESMKAARHNSVSAHLSYMESNFVSEKNKIDSLLKSNNTGLLCEPAAKKLKMSPENDQKPCHHHSGSNHPCNTQEEYEAFQKELKIAKASNDCFNYGSSETKRVEESSALRDISNSYRFEPSPRSFLKPNGDNNSYEAPRKPTKSEQALAMARSSFESFAKVPPPTKTYTHSNQQEYIINPYTGKPLVKMSQEQARIRGLKNELKRMNEEAEAMKREHAMEVQDYEQRLVDLQGSFSFNHNGGNWSSGSNSSRGGHHHGNYHNKNNNNNNNNYKHHYY
jgi:hypothetical protein